MRTVTIDGEQHRISGAVIAVGANGQALSSGSGGDASAANQTLMNAVLGVPTGTAVITDANGTIQQFLRGLVKMVAATIGVYDMGFGQTTSSGLAGTRFTSADQSGGVAAVSDAPTSGKKLVITDIEISVDGPMRVDFTEETTGTMIASVYMSANSTVNLCTRAKRKLLTANKKLQVQTSAAGNIAVTAFYYSET